MFDRTLRENQQPHLTVFDNLSEAKPNRPRVGITIGDPAGIGAEVVLKAVAAPEVSNVCQSIIIGDHKFLAQTALKLNLPFGYPVVKSGVEIAEISSNSKAVVLDLDNISETVVTGVESAATGRASAEYIERAAEMCLAGKLDAMTTAPISKRALSLAGYDFPGHTEFLAHLTKTDEFAMSFFAGQLRVILLSTHVSLRRALDLIKREPLVRLIRLAHRELVRLGIENPRLAVAALNPHGGEGQMFGNEEVAEINPAVLECQAEGINVGGAFSADTIFWRAMRGDFDAVIALYHDQATIPVKSISFGESVNVTLGLPLIRTSVDHGTAFDIAGLNLAEHSSMKSAILLAAELAANRRNATDKNARLRSSRL